MLVRQDQRAVFADSKRETAVIVIESGDAAFPADEEPEVSDASAG
jgi:hypothetical protein